MSTPAIAVVIPCYRVTKHILDVLNSIGPECAMIFVIDDCCPEGSGRLVEQTVRDPRVRVIYHQENRGVGGAVVTGYKAALAAGATVVAKIDGDGQMDPRLLNWFVAPLLRGEADYTKGNRFYALRNIRTMPAVRVFGNSTLSFITKMSSGYWHIFDPANGYTAIHAAALSRLDLDGLSARYFFESDLLISLGGIRAVVSDIPMEAVYGDEVSGLRVRKVAFEFLLKNMREAAKRILYAYFLRDFNLASLNLVFGLLLLGSGAIFGSIEWVRSIETGIPATTGTVILATLPVILGFQLMLAFLSYDISNEPRVPLQGVVPSDRLVGADRRHPGLGI